jgi:hypothetical protein
MYEVIISEDIPAHLESCEDAVSSWSTCQRRETSGRWRETGQSWLEPGGVPASGRQFPWPPCFLRPGCIRKHQIGIVKALPESPHGALSVRELGGRREEGRWKKEEGRGNLRRGGTKVGKDGGVRHTISGDIQNLQVDCRPSGCTISTRTSHRHSDFPHQTGRRNISSSLSPKQCSTMSKSLLRLGNGCNATLPSTHPVQCHRFSVPRRCLSLDLIMGVYRTAVGPPYLCLDSRQLAIHPNNERTRSSHPQGPYQAEQPP